MPSQYAFSKSVDAFSWPLVVSTTLLDAWYQAACRYNKTQQHGCAPRYIFHYCKSSRCTASIYREGVAVVALQQLLLPLSPAARCALYSSFLFLTLNYIDHLLLPSPLHTLSTGYGPRNQLGTTFSQPEKVDKKKLSRIAVIKTFHLA